MYESQTHSKEWRNLDNTFGKMFKVEEAYEIIHSKHFKKYYAGNPTKRYLKLMRIIDA